MASQERVRANKFNRKHQHVFWGEKTRRGGTGVVLYGGGTGVALDQDKLKVNCDAAITAGGGLMMINVPPGGTAVVPFDTVVVPGVGLTLSGPGAAPVLDAVYYVGFSIRLFVPGTVGPIDVRADLYKAGTYYQNIIDDQTPAALEKERRFHAGDYVRAASGDTLQVRLVNPGPTPIAYAVTDAYLDVGHGPRR